MIFSVIYHLKAFQMMWMNIFSETSSQLFFINF